MSVQIGVLAVQGDVRENILSTRRALDELGIQGSVLQVKAPDAISGLDGLIIPGGESTTIGQLSLVNDSMQEIRNRIHDGMPVLGICAGLILLSRTVNDLVIGKTQQPLLGALDIQLERNSFGRQNESFETYLSMEPIGIAKFRGVFIRAPSVAAAAADIQVLSRIGEKIVAVKKDNIIGTAFHPELTDDTSLHRHFVSMACQTN